jgi:transposase
MAKMPIAVLGIDLGNSCSVAGLDTTGAVVLRRRMTREGLVAFASKLPACIVAMEACCGAHFLGWTFAAQGHTVRLMSPEYVQPYVKSYVKSQKTDDRDAEAIAEAATRPTMRLVTLKSEAQLDLQVLHRARERLVAARTRLTNQLRAVLLERA